MSQSTGKKTEQVALKLAPELFEVLGKIAEIEDRPLGYVARELMIRGITLYEWDGRLRERQPLEETKPGVRATTVDVGTKKGRLAEVVGKIEPGNRAQVQQMIDDAEIAKPRKRKTG